jgi:hypothetical protein
VSKHERAKNLDDKAIADIVTVIDGWSGKLSWELLLEAVEKRLRQRYTRQALNNHTRVAEAFRLRKKSLGEQARQAGRPRRGDASQELDAALQRIQVLEAENVRLSSENARFLEQFVRWAHNAYTRGLDKNFLDQPLPVVQRDRTKVTMEELNRRRR